MFNMRTLTENGVEIELEEQFSSPARSKVFFNPKMQLNRELVLCALTAFLEDRTEKVTKCLDAFGATGVAGLQWMKHHGQKADITICDLKEEAVTRIQHNCALNGLKVKGDGSDVSGVEVVCEDVNVLLHQRAFDFVHLDPFGCTVQYLDATFRNISNHGIVSISSTDTSALFSKCDRVTLRHYQARLCRTEYMKELAVRLVVAAAVRAAARCNKGINVLLSTAAEHFVLVIVRIKRGPSKADACMQKLQQVLHCQMCMERVFLAPSLILQGNPYRLLSCRCHQSTPGNTAVCIGPVWSGGIFNVDFVQKMTIAATELKLGKKVQKLLQVSCEEAKCSQKCVKTKTENHNAHVSQQLGAQNKIADSSYRRQSADPNESLSFDVTTNIHSNITGIVTKKEGPKENCKSNHRLIVKKTGDFETADGQESNTIQSTQENSRTASSADETSSVPANSTTTRDTDDGNVVIFGKRKNGGEDGAGEETRAKDCEKRFCADPRDACCYEQEPAFYYNMHNHSVKDSDSPKLCVLIDNLQQSGFRASRTHFDGKGVRTNASKVQFAAVLSKCSPPTRK